MAPDGEDSAGLRVAAAAFFLFAREGGREIRNIPPDAPPPINDPALGRSPSTFCGALLRRVL